VTSGPAAVGWLVPPGNGQLRRAPPTAAAVRSWGWPGGCQEEPVEAVGVDDRIDRGDLAVEDGEAAALALVGAQHDLP